MLIIEYYEQDDITAILKYKWRKNDVWTKAKNVSRVISVTANGEELTIIRNKITGIHNQNHGDTSKWFGDDAKFITAFFQMYPLH